MVRTVLNRVGKTCQPCRARILSLDRARSFSTSSAALTNAGDICSLAHCSEQSSVDSGHAPRPVSRSRQLLQPGTVLDPVPEGRQSAVVDVHALGLPWGALWHTCSSRSLAVDAFHQAQPPISPLAEQGCTLSYRTERGGSEPQNPHVSKISEQTVLFYVVVQCGNERCCDYRKDCVSADGRTFFSDHQEL